MEGEVDVVVREVELDADLAFADVDVGDICAQSAVQQVVKLIVNRVVREHGQGNVEPYALRLNELNRAGDRSWRMDRRRDSPMEGDE